MKCRRCQREIKDNESDSLISFTNLIRAGTKTATLCERCSLEFIEWFSRENYIQKQINAEEAKETTYV